MLKKFSAFSLRSTVCLAVLFTSTLEAQVPDTVLPPIPPVKPAELLAEAEENWEPELSENTDRSRYRPFLLYEGGIGDQVAGEGVVILGPSGNGELSLNLIEQLGLGGNAFDNEIAIDADVLDESPAAQALRNRRAALRDLLSREQAISFDLARIKALDKVTGEISEFRIPVNQDISFGDLRIKARSCQVSPPGEPPERAAFLQIEDTRRPDLADDQGHIFSGWMLSSNPAISAMDHAIYDVWVIDCLSSKP